MAYTLAQMLALEAALAAGITSVSYEGKSVDYRSLNEMRQILADMKTQLSGQRVIRRFHVRTRKGL